MYQTLEHQLNRLADEPCLALLSQGFVGLEKESLRVSPDGSIAQTPHPRELGSALTHPYITTDYSEALLELITPPCTGTANAMEFLRDLHKFVYRNLDQEILWATSMPCVLSGGGNIPIAQYGHSNAGQMKTVYRRGLGHRYGRVMQVIAGVHYNFSFAESLWPLLQEIVGDGHPLRQFIDGSYFGLTRNLQRYGWLVPYLFGASPAICKSFLGDKPTRLPSFDRTTYYEPYATSLRMGDIGYTNTKEKGIGIKANYNSLEEYVASLKRAIETPSPLWRRLGVKVNGRYEQLSDAILQIENEYYSTVRPKQILDGLEKPILALQRRGVRYVELRSLDVNAYHPLGVSEEQLLFLKAFMLFCLLMESPPVDLQEQREIDQNFGAVAHRGRDPELMLLRHGREIPLQQWALEICDRMQGVCELLDRGQGDERFSRELARQREVVMDPQLTPSARMLQEMRDRGEGFFAFAQRMSLQHRDYFDRLGMDPTREQEFVQMAVTSHQRQLEIEQSDEVDFDRFLADYFSQE